MREDAITKKNYYPNMDLMRYVLALGVIVAHFNELAHHDVPFFISSFESVGAFFVLSGFLVYPSFEKHRRLGRYISGRARRILPPYLFIVLLCALGLVFVSALPALDYFSSSGFWKYLAANVTFLNWIHPDLPGVFEGPEYLTPAVNGSLWTMKVEWCLYLSVPVTVWFISRFHTSRLTTVCWIIVLSLLYRQCLMWLYDYTGSNLVLILSRQFFGQLAYFYIGVAIYFCLDRFKRHLAAMFGIGLFLYIIYPHIPSGDIFIAPFAVGLVVMAISLTEKTPGLLRHRHNVSYELYLFHFPLIQLLIYTGFNNLPVYYSFPVLLLCVTLLSLLSHFLLLPLFYRKKSSIR